MAERRPLFRTLSARLTAWYAVSSFALMLALASVLFVSLERGLAHENDELIEDRMAHLRSLFAERSVDESDVRRFVDSAGVSRKADVLYVRILSADGSTRLVTQGIPQFLETAEFPLPGGRTTWSGERPPGSPTWRLGADSFTWGAGGPPVVCQIAVDRHDDEAILERYLRRVCIALGIAAAASVVIGQVIARRELAPLREIGDAARRVRSTRLGERIDGSRYPEEIAALAARFNEMLGHLEESFARLSQFSGDLAHELRTPIQALRSQFDVALSQSRSAEEYRETVASGLEDCVRLAEIVDRLLFLARAEDPRTQVRREAVDLGAELEAIREFWEPVAAEKGVAISVDAGAGCPAHADRALLQRAVGNLVSNAITHTPRGGRVSVSAASRDGGAVIAVSDTGPGIPLEAQARVFDRFFRVDAARTGNGFDADAPQHVGLGLAIVKSIVTLHGGTVTLQSVPGEGTTVALWIPGASV